MKLQMERFQAGFAWNCKGKALWTNSLGFLIGYDGLMCCRIETKSATHTQPATVSAKLGNKVSTAMGLIFNDTERQKERGRDRERERPRCRDRDRERQKERETEREREAEIERGRERRRQTGRETDRGGDRQTETERQKHRETDP